ncbi:hypothetical protein SAMN05421761_12113 [Belliella pelovolcani]|uniref:Uncharacterized protein n=2 Tax=Belliella pelovolcani TaxID=529505 RepID=A0A1N7PUT3_9BACT|nr:hypothetical protein SAMN05421761_12113 [Belliella pelovolcani]
MKHMVILGLILFVILIPVGIWMQNQAKNKGKKHFEVFNAADIDNRIESVRIAYKGTGMKLDDGREFIFYPLTDKRLNEGSIFNYTAESGDKVEKRAFSDTLYLYKGDKILMYTFTKF